MPPKSVHFNGSLNLADASTVMHEVSARIPQGVRRITDGETGDRSYWVVFQIEKFDAMPEFERVTQSEPFMVDGVEAPAMPWYTLADGVDPAAIEWPDLGYADAYIESFKVFASLQADGTIAPDTRMQIQYPTPLAVILCFIHPDAAGLIAEPLAASYEKALLADLDRALERIPHDRCAVQWDIAFEIDLLEGATNPAKTVSDPATRGLYEHAYRDRVTDPIGHVAGSLARYIDRIPADVHAGLHLCYGDFAHEHFTQPVSLKLQVDLLNAVAARASRAMNFCGFTVPQNQSEPSFFAPLAGLQTGSETELAFGLVPYHPEGTEAATTARQVSLIDTALAASRAGSRDWAVSTECGMGRCEPNQVLRLLDLHRDMLSLAQAR